MFKSVDELQKLARQQIEAATASAAAVSRGVQQIAAESSDFARKSVEDGSTVTTRLMGVESFDGAVRIQADYARSAFAGLVAQASRMGGLMVAVGQDAAKPFEAVLPFGKAGRD